MPPRAKKALSVNSESRVPKEPKECLKGKKILLSNMAFFAFLELDGRRGVGSLGAIDENK